MNVIYNELMDKVITAVTESFKATGQRTLSVPEINESFERLMIEGGVKTTEGTLEDLTTLRRTSDVTVNMVAGTAVIKVGLTLDYLKLKYPRCKVWLGPINTSDVLTVTVNKNVIDVQVSVNAGKHVKAKLDFVKVVELTGISVEFKGGRGILNPLVKVVTDYMHKQIEDIIEKRVNEVLQKELTKVNFGSVFPTGSASKK